MDPTLPTPHDQRQLELLLEQVGDEAVQDIAQEFLRDLPKDLELLRQQVAAGDLVMAGKTAHRIKGQALAFGLSAMVAACQRLERQPHEDPQGTLAQIEAAWAAAQPWLRQRLGLT